jgi:bisphosphoglycerate-dependent phosphoglycerate mutase family 1
LIPRGLSLTFFSSGLFTGWEDVPLADEGIEEAKEAGRLLKLHGFEFDVVYTSWLSRALETALYVMDEMDSLWLPTVKTWRLNERYVLVDMVNSLWWVSIMKNREIAKYVCSCFTVMKECMAN